MQGVALGAERGELVQQVMVQMTFVDQPAGSGWTTITPSTSTISAFMPSVP
jgi:hypothetical protein